MAGCEGHNPEDAPLPPAVKEWWVATGCAEFWQHQLTITLPPPVYSWWEATGSSQFASAATKEVPGLVFTGSLDPVLQTTSTGQTTTSTSSSGVGVGTTVPDSTPITTSNSEPTSIPKTSPNVSPHPSTTMNPNSTTTIAPTKTRSGSGSASRAAGVVFATPSTPSDAGNTALTTAVSSPTVSSTPSQTQINASHIHSGKNARVVAGVVTPLVLLLLLAAALALYKRRRRARDRREWERTHEAIADAVRQVGGTPAAPWSPPRGDVKGPLEGDSAPLFEKSVGTPPG
ncbi:hypothetical protein DFH08DRAFT_388419 [Mycena albidolilacea]|uniref:Uncharacterized protein n=1 Tax=Mycena albidolilacea TaxID=1033008 RepID=A0AAD6ZFP7_9AGAR|nr:hypothetical protein DFH08DRAFT_388419 [Mycena albidolilacea]